MLKNMATFVALLIVALPAGVAAKDAVKSGCKVGDRIPTFNVEDVTGPNRGRALCYV